MRQPTDGQLERLRAAMTELLAAMKDFNRASLRFTTHVGRFGEVLSEMVTYMDGDAP